VRAWRPQLLLLLRLSPSHFALHAQGGKKCSSTTTARPLCLPHPAGTLTLAAGAPPAAPYRWDGESSVLSLSLLYHSFLPSLSLLRGSRVTGGEGVMGFGGLREVWSGSVGQFGVGFMAFFFIGVPRVCGEIGWGN
jgi:hypothetical protein